MAWQPDFGHAQETDLARQRGDDACALLATEIVSNAYKSQEQQFLAKSQEQKFLAGCAKHPDPSVCQNTKQFIETSVRPIPELVCVGNGPSRIDQSPPTNRGGWAALDELGDDPTDACTRYVTLKVHRLADTREKEWLVRCSRHPDPSVCQNTKNFLAEEKVPAPELVCRKK
jgi:hypothetical protein